MGIKSIFADFKPFKGSDVPRDGRELLFVYRDDKNAIPYRFVVVKWIEPFGWTIAYYKDNACLVVENDPDYWADIQENIVERPGNIQLKLSFS